MGKKRFVCSEKSEVGLEVSGKTEHPKFSLGYGVRKGAKSGTETGVLQSQLAPIMLAYIHEAPAAFEALSWAV